MKKEPWTRLRAVLAELDRSLWQESDADAAGIVRVVMTFKHTKPLRSSRVARAVPPPANDLSDDARDLLAPK